jgi:hypothetical protein
MSHRPRYSRRAFLRDSGATAAGWALAGALHAAPAAANPIVAENRRPGTRDWLLTRLEPSDGTGREPQWQRRPAIEAYCSHPSLRAGETLRVFVSTNPASTYEAEIFRMGYYGGTGGRSMRRIGPLRGRMQPTPADEARQLVQCRWEPGFELVIPADWLSGVYLGKLRAAASGYEAYFIFIVRDDRRSDFLFQCSDTTWQAYNRWPAWRSLYDWQGNPWHTAPGPEVSFDRPYGIYYNNLPAFMEPRTNGSGEFLLWEQPLCFWMEQEGYDVTYISNLDTHTDPAGLRRAKGFLSVGHDEYWSAAMYRHVEAARDAGVHLAFLSGNTLSGRILLRPGHDGRPDRIFARHEEGGSAFFQNEHELMGASSYGVGAADWICRAPGHWLYAGTGMEEGDTIPQLIGWEYHGPPLRADPSLVVLASGRTSRRYIVRDGHDYAAVLYTARRGNIVFNAATCWWSMLLARPPGATNPPRETDFSRVDARVQRMTRNLFARILAPLS